MNTTATLNSFGAEKRAQTFTRSWITDSHGIAIYFIPGGYEVCRPDHERYSTHLLNFEFWYDDEECVREDLTTITLLTVTYEHRSRGLHDSAAIRIAVFLEATPFETRGPSSRHLIGELTLASPLHLHEFKTWVYHTNRILLGN